MIKNLETFIRRKSEGFSSINVPKILRIFDTFINKKKIQTQYSKCLSLAIGIQK